MALQREGGAKQSFALLTLEGSLLRVSLLVILVHVAVSELFPTQFTFVGFVLAVDDLVSRHLVQALEGAAADLTGVRSLLRVCDHVAFQLICRNELLVTRIAFKYFMNLPVLLQIQRGGAFPVTYVACEFPTCTSCVDIPFMLLQSIFALEPFAAALCFTDEPGVSFTGLFMLLKTGFRAERVVAERALVSFRVT